MNPDRKSDCERLAEGAERVLAGEYVGMEMHCYNFEEMVKLKGFMDERYPAVPVKWFWNKFS